MGSDAVCDLAVDFVGVCGPALWDQWSTRLRLPVEVGVASN